MSKIRITVSLIVLALVLISTHQLAAAKTQVGSSYPYNLDSVVKNAGETTSSLNRLFPPRPLPQEECVDLPFGAAASVYACPNPSQIPVPEGWNWVNTASKTLNAFAPSNASALLKCADLPFGVVVSAFACPNPSQVPVPDW